jgi:hypothetical protein
MWTEAFWIALGVVIVVVLSAAAAAFAIGIAVQRAADRRRARRIAADPDRVTVDDIQAKIVAASRQVVSGSRWTP